MMPLRVAMPSRVMKPTNEATDNVPPERKTITIPPINADVEFTNPLNVSNGVSKLELALKP
jgi:hypothetical protein